MKTSNRFVTFYFAILTVVALLSCSCQSQTEQRREAYQHQCDSLQELSVQDCRDSANAYAEELMLDGYSADWAYHKAYVEYGIDPIDDEYIAIQED